MKTRFLFAVAGAAALSACTTAPYADTAHSAGMPTAAMPMTPQGFTHMAAANSAYEIQAAQIALQMSTDPQVRAFAEKMIQDHTMATQTLMQAAAQARPAVTVNTSLTAEQQANLAALRNARTNFDMVYKQQMEMSHEKAVTLLNTYMHRGDAMALQNWARNNLPTIQQHLVMAQQLR